MADNLVTDRLYYGARSKKLLVLLWTFWFSVLFSPLLNVGVLLRVDQIILPLVLALFLIKKKFRILVSYAGRWFAQYALLSAFIGLVGGVLSLFIEGVVNWYFIVNWPIKICLHLIVGIGIMELTAKGGRRLLPMALRPLLIGTAIVGLVAVFQILEFRGYIPDVGINRFLSLVYPYRVKGEPTLTVSGYRLKTGRIGQATATFDGHPILLGNYLAFSSLLLLPLVRSNVRVLVLILAIAGLLLSLARASVVAWFAGVVLFLALLGIRSSASTRLKSFVMYIARMSLVALVLGVIYIATPLDETVRWRLVTTVQTFQGIGPEEGRLTAVWPETVKALQKTGLTAWLLGKPGGYAGATDSQYLWILANTGIMGLFLFVRLHLCLLLFGVKTFARVWHVDRTISLLGLGYTCAVVALMLMYIANPSLQGDRLLTTLVVVSLMLDNDVRELNNYKKNYD